METFYSLTPDLLGRLDSKAAIGFFGQLLWAQARRRGVPITKIHFSLRENVPDGGIDAAVDADAIAANDDVLVQGNTFYQVKAGTTAAPWQPSWVQEELFGAKKKINPANLGSCVRECLENGGRYVLVCFGASLGEDRTRISERNFKDCFKQCGFPDARVEALSQENLVGLFSNYPSLCLAMSGRDVGNLQSHASWTRNDDMLPAAELGEPQRQCLEEIQGYLRGKDVRYIRIVGEPGIGKTRLVLEATRAEDLSPCVVYVPHAEEFQKDPLFTVLLHPDATYYVILVLDECPVRDGAEIWNVLKNRSAGCSIVAIDHDPSGGHDAAMREVSCPGLNADQIVTILHNYVPGKLECSRWMEVCGDSPRVAHALGENLKANPDDLLRSPATVPIWERFVAGRSDLESAEVQQRLVVLRHLSLFARFGFEEPVHEEAQYIAGLAQKVDATLTWGQFQSVVALLRKRRILQGTRTLFIAPRLLQVHLWRDFWENYGCGADLTEFFAALPRGLRSWCLQMLPYAHISPVATRAVEKFLGPAGVFSNPNSQAFHEACAYLSKLAEAAPELTLACVENIIAQADPAQFSNIGRDKFQFVWALQKIAVWRNLCQRSVQALLELAAMAGNSDQIRTTFAELFSLATGQAAPTEAEPALRLPVLGLALKSSDHTKRTLALKACQSALSINQGGRSIGPEYQGLRPTAKLWTPNTWGELFDAYAAVWNLLVELSRSWALEERREANRILLEFAPGLLFDRHLDDLILTTLENLVQDDATDLQQLVERIVLCCGLWKDHVSDVAKERLAALDARITGTTLVSRIRRFVFFASQDEYFNASPASDDLPRKIGELAQETVDHPEVFESVLCELIKGGPTGIYAFGFQVAMRDTPRKLMYQLIDAQRSADAGASTQFLGGYLRQLYDSDRPACEKVIKDLFADSATNALAAELVSRTGLTKAMFQELLEKHDAGKIDFSHFHSVMMMCQPSDLDDEHVQGLLRRWNELPGERASEFPLRLLDWYYCGGTSVHPLPEQSTLDVLQNDAIYDDERFHGHHWKAIVDRFLEDYPQKALDVLSTIVEQVIRVRSISFDFDHYVQAVAGAIIKGDPKASWAVVAAAIGDPRSDKARAIWHWLNPLFPVGMPVGGLLSLFPIELVLGWIAESPHLRAASVAESVPKSLEPSDQGALLRHLLVLYGDQDDVRRALFYRFCCDHWSGSESDHYRGLRDRARTWLANEEHPNVRQWLEDYIRSKTADIERAEIAEEREY